MGVFWVQRWQIKNKITYGYDMGPLMVEIISSVKLEVISITIEHTVGITLTVRSYPTVSTTRLLNHF